MAARSFVQSASHSSIDWGSATGAVVVLPPVVVAVAPLVVVAPPAVVAVLLSLLSSPPHAAATRARLMNPATTPTLRRLCTDIPSSSQHGVFPDHRSAAIVRHPMCRSSQHRGDARHGRVAPRKNFGGAAGPGDPKTAGPCPTCQLVAVRCS